MYSKRLFLKSFLLFFLLSCQSSIPAQEYKESDQKSSEVTEKVELEERQPIFTGADQIPLLVEILKNKHVGVIGNQTSRVGEKHLVDTLLDLDISIVKVFSPEHGFRGKADAGAKVESEKDKKTGLPIISLYGSNKKPKQEQLEGLDVLVFDLQDVGTRFYTYISTLHYVMEAAAESNLQVIVLDRPNPNGGYVDGPVRKEGYESFVGMHPIPIVHGMTVGEIAQMINGEKWLKGEVQCNLTVVPCQNYSREMEYSIPVSPSPNLRSDEAIQLYPSLCLFEGTSVSVGRGTKQPFEIFGHPQLEGKEFADFSFTPKASFGAQHPKLEGEKCFGQNLAVKYKGKQFHQLHLEWLIEAYKAIDSPDFFITKNKWFDLLAGTDELRKQIIAGKTEAEIRASWQEDLEAFKKMRTPYLIY